MLRQSIALTAFFILTSLVSLSAQDVQPEFFGKKITMEKAKSVSKSFKKLKKKDDIAIKIKGTVEAVCTKKGCWMNVVDEITGDKVFVKFKDYGFFVPLNSAGKTVVMEGVLLKEITSVDELRHFAEDSNKSAEEIAAITEPKEEYKFIADGVILF